MSVARLFSVTLNVMQKHISAAKNFAFGLQTAKSLKSFASYVGFYVELNSMTSSVHSSHNWP